MNDEIRMTNDERMPGSRRLPGAKAPSSVLSYFFVIRHSSFVISEEVPVP